MALVCGIPRFLLLLRSAIAMGFEFDSLLCRCLADMAAALFPRILLLLFRLRLNLIRGSMSVVSFSELLILFYFFLFSF